MIMPAESDKQKIWFTVNVCKIGVRFALFRKFHRILVKLGRNEQLQLKHIIIVFQINVVDCQYY